MRLRKHACLRPEAEIRNWFCDRLLFGQSGRPQAWVTASASTFKAAKWYLGNLGRFKSEVGHKLEA